MLDSLLRFVGDDLDGIVAAEPLAALTERAASIPVALTRLLGLEVPLEAPDAPVDLLVALAPPRALRVLLQHEPDLATRLGGGPELAALLTALTEPSAPLHGSCGRAWLEYDVGSGDPLIPSLFSAPAGSAAVVPLASLLAGRQLEPPVRRTVERVVESLDSGEIVMQVGVMHGRGDAGVRLVLLRSGGGAEPGLRAALAAGWEGPVDQVVRLLARYGSSLEHRSLALAVRPDGTIADTVGLELHLRGLEHAQRVLGILVEAGLVSPGVARLLIRWYGYALDPKGDASPESFRLAAELTRGRMVPAVIRWILHVKLTARSGVPPSAKAYLGARLHLRACPRNRPGEVRPGF